MSRNEFPAARPIFPSTGIRALSILTLVTLVMVWAPRCEAGSENQPVSGMGYTVFATGLAGTLTAYKSAKKVKVVASGLDKPHGLAFDNTGVTYINEWSGNRLLKMDQKGRLQPVATVEDPVGVAIGKSGDLYVAQPQAGKVSRVKMDGTRVTLIEGLNEPRDPAFDEAGNLFVAETGAGRILKMTGDF